MYGGEGTNNRENLSSESFESEKSYQDRNRQLGAKVLAAQNEKVQNNNERKPWYNEELNKLVFDDIDVKTVVGLIKSKIEKIDSDKLLELHQSLENDLSHGGEMTEEYFSELLQLDKTPKLNFSELPKGIAGNCSPESLNPYGEPDIITIDPAKCNYDPNKLLGAIAHENWHSWQHQIMTLGMRDDAPKQIKYLSGLYSYNDKNYIRSEDDIEGYENQLIELEARLFAKAIQEKAAEAKNDYFKAEFFMELYPEIYGEENLAGIEQEIDGVLHGIDLDAFVAETGAKNLNELWEMHKNEQIISGYATALSHLAELKQPVTLRFIDKTDQKWIKSDFETNRIEINRKTGWGYQPMMKLPEIIWEMRQRELARDEPDSKRGRLYNINLAVYIRDTNKNRKKAHQRQLLNREKDYFANELLTILDEQALEDEIESLPPAEQVAIRKEQKELNREPVVSHKYEIRRSNGNAN